VDITTVASVATIAATALDRRHRPAGEAERAETLGAGERRPEADEWPEREGEEDAIARRNASSAINGFPAFAPPLPGISGVEETEGRPVVPLV